jgi:hypothetical protein
VPPGAKLGLVRTNPGVLVSRTIAPDGVAETVAVEPAVPVVAPAAVTAGLAVGVAPGVAELEQAAIATTAAAPRAKRTKIPGTFPHLTTECVGKPPPD